MGRKRPNTLFVLRRNSFLLKIGARINHASLTNGMKIEIFGGEDDNSNALNDSWRLEVNYTSNSIFFIQIGLKFSSKGSNMH